jgi:predicted secreted hydrolase
MLLEALMEKEVDDDDPGRSLPPMAVASRYAVGMRLDLSPNPSAPIEWWYAQGRLRNARGGAHDVMVVCFRVELPGESPTSMIIASHVDVAAARQCTRNIVSDGLLRAAEHLARSLGGRVSYGSMMRLCLHAFHRTARAGWWADVEISAAPARFAAAPLAIDWMDFALRVEGDEIALSCNVAREQSRIRLRLSPITPWNYIDGDLEPGFDLAGYRTCPRLKARGEIDGEDVEGVMWFDQQWGGLRQTLVDDGSSTPRFLGWDWFALNLDDGSDLMIYQRRDMMTGAVVDCIGSIFENGDWRHFYGGCRAIGREFRLGPRGLVRFPSRWEIVAPDLGLELTLLAAHGRGEVPVLGPVHVIWEGPSAVTGSRHGRPVGGSAWVELYGYGRPLALAAYFRFFVNAARSIATTLARRW